MPLTHADIDAVCGLVLDLCGVYLDESKSYLIENRLADLVQRAECSDYVQLARKARLGSIELKTEIVNAITTTETHFFRDATPFDALQHKAVPELVDARAGSLQPRRLRIWSAACSTGQEPYSIAMTLCDLLPDIHDWDISILATDVADDVVQTASRGVYRKLDIERGMNPNLLRKYFIAEGDRWRVSDELRSLIHFQRLNLLHAFGHLGPFDIVFCRNVAIYFTPESRTDLFERVRGVLRPDGYLFVGSTELLGDLGPAFSPHHHCRATFYRPNQPTST